MAAPINVYLLFVGATSSSWTEDMKAPFRQLISSLTDSSLAGSFASAYGWWSVVRQYKDDRNRYVSDTVTLKVRGGEGGGRWARDGEERGEEQRTVVAAGVSESVDDYFIVQ